MPDKEGANILRDSLNNRIRLYIKYTVKKLGTWKKDYINGRLAICLTCTWIVWVKFFDLVKCICRWKKSGTSCKESAKFLVQGIMWMFQARRLSYRKLSLLLSTANDTSRPWNISALFKACQQSFVHLIYLYNSSQFIEHFHMRNLPLSLWW